MSSEPLDGNRLRATMLLLALFLGAVLTASVAIAAAPSGQGKKAGTSAPLPQKQPEDPRKGPEKPSPPYGFNLQGGTQYGVQAPSGVPCGPGSVYFDAEPNNTITNSQALASTNQAEVRGSVDYGGDADYYSFQAVAGDRIWAYAFTLGAVSTTDSQLTLLNALSQTVQFDDDNGSQADLSSAIAGAVITQTATYYLKINAFSSTSTIFNYTLFIDRTSTPPVPEVEPNNTFTQTNPFTVGSVVTGSIPITTDMDVYEFEFNDDRRYVFHVDGDPERDGVEFNPNFDLMNNSGAVLVTVDSDSQFDVREVNSENAAFFIDTGGTPTSTLLLRVRADGNNTGSYNLHIWEVGTQPCGNTPTPTATATATPVCNTFVSEIEPNSTFTASQVLPPLNDLEVRASINPAGDIDYYQGSATMGDRVWAYLFTGQSTTGADSELRLLNALSATLQYDDDNGSQTAASSGIAGAPIGQTGNIHFRVNEFNNDGTITPYLLLIDLTSSVPNVTEVEPNDVYTDANMVTVGDLITGTIPITTDLDVYGFTVNAGDRIIFQADGDPERDGVQYNPNFQILDSAGTQLVAVDSDSTLGDKRSEHHAFTFGSAGTYYVRLSSDSSESSMATGSYNLHLWRTVNPPCSGATPTPTRTSTSTNTVVPPTSTRTPTPTNTLVPATSTRTSTPTNTSVPPTSTPTPPPTNTVVPPTSTNTAVPATSTQTPTTLPSSTNTAVPPTSTNTAVPPTSTNTVVVPTSTNTGVPATSTNTSIPATSTNTSVPPTSTNTAVPPTSTNTAVVPTSTSTATTTSTNTSIPPTSTNTRVPPTSTNTASSTATATVTVVPSATVCTLNFPDNRPGDTFYEYIQCLVCRGVVSGFSDGRFHADYNITRGQISKVVSNAAGFFEDPGEQIYADVPPSHIYYAFINRLTRRGIMSGYPCPTRPNGEPCSPNDPAIFLPNANATRGQLAKIVSNAAGFDEAVSGQFYADVPPSGEGSEFYEWIMRLTNRGVMSGYPCGTVPEEPCDEEDRPYFRWSAQVTRGQASKIVANTFFPDCETPDAK